MTTCTAPKSGLSGYKHYRCRCDDCIAANRANVNNRTRMIAYGQWEGMVDADPVRQHVRALMDGGMTRDKVMERAGISNGCISRLLYGKAGMPPCVKVRSATAKRILAVAPTLDDLSERALIDATGTRRRTQALATIGWSISEQARRVGRQHKHHQAVLTDTHVTARIARLVRDLYAELSMTPAPPGQSATRTRRMAADRGWLSPLDWGDDIDLPEAEPEPLEQDAIVVDEVVVERVLAGEQLALNDAELIATLQACAGRGRSLSALAMRLGLNYAVAKKIVEGELPPAMAKRAARREVA